jgi:hypothetical protein
MINIVKCIVDAICIPTIIIGIILFFSSKDIIKGIDKKEISDSTAILIFYIIVLAMFAASTLISVHSYL